MDKKTIKLYNGETLAYLHEPNPGKKTLLLLHGNMSSSRHYEPLITRLKEHFELMVPDLRGFGDSSYHRPIESLEDFADDCASFLARLKNDRVYLVGWSTGGGIALKFAAKYPQLTEALILIESASYRGYPIYEKDENYTSTKQLYTSKEAMAHDPVQVLPALKAIENQDLEFMKKIWMQAIYNVHVPKDEALIRYLKETLKQRNLIDVDWALMNFNMSETQNGVAPGDGSIKDINVPVLSIWGQNDRVINKMMFEETVAVLNDVTPYIFEKGSHAPITDNPDQLSKLIKTFIGNN